MNRDQAGNLPARQGDYSVNFTAALHSQKHWESKGSSFDYLHIFSLAFESISNDSSEIVQAWIVLHPA